MTSKLINFSATFILAVLLSQVLPWWSVMLASFITAILFRLKHSAVFFIPFFAITIFWMVYAFWLSQSNDFTLAKKIAVLLPLNGNSYLLIALTGLLGGLAAGISAVFGKQCVSMLNTTKS